MLVSEKGDKTVIALNCDLDGKNALKLKPDITKLARKNRKSLELNLSNVFYIDSSGINLLLTVHKIQHDHSNKLIISGVNPAVKKNFELSHLDQLFEIV